MTSSKLPILHYLFYEFGSLTIRDWLDAVLLGNLVVPSSNEYLSNLQLLTKKGSYCTWRHRTSHSSLFWESTTWSGPFSTKVEFSERISSEVGRWNKNWGFESEICFWKSNSTNIYHCFYWNQMHLLWVKTENPAAKKFEIRFSIDNSIPNVSLYALTWPKLNFGYYVTFKII